MMIGNMEPISHTTQPIVTGSGVVAIKTNDFVMLAADTLGSYGSLARYHNIHRIRKINPYTVLGAGGEISDFQSVLDSLHELSQENVNYNDNVKLHANEIHNYVSRICYHRRSKANPYYNQFIVGGMMGENHDIPYLGYTDLYGTTYIDDYATTGFGLYYAMPLLRKHYRNDLSLNEARTVIALGMKVLFYRDCKMINKFQFCVIDKHGVNISEPVALDTAWDLSEINPVPKKPLYPKLDDEEKVEEIDIDPEQNDEQ